MTKEQLRILKLPMTTYVNGDILANVKCEPNRDIYYFVVGNDWTNIKRNLYFEMTYTEMIESGWSKA